MCVGIPGQIVGIVDEKNAIATVDISGVRRSVNVACVVDKEHPIAGSVGDWVLVHVGFAMSRIDEDEARQTLEFLNGLGDLENEVEAIRESEGGTL